MAVRERLNAAWIAFKDPWLVVEAVQMRQCCEDLVDHGEVGILDTQYVGDHPAPKVVLLGEEGQEVLHQLLVQGRV